MWEKLTQQGDDSPQVFCDPGVFLPCLFPKQTPRWPLGIVPHYVDQDEPFVLQAAAGGAKIIDLTAPLEQNAASLSSCERIPSSSLPGIVFSLPFGIPRARIKISDRAHWHGVKIFLYLSSLRI